MSGDDMLCRTDMSSYVVYMSPHAYICMSSHAYICMPQHAYICMPPPDSEPYSCSTEPPPVCTQEMCTRNIYIYIYIHIYIQHVYTCSYLR